MRSGSGVYASLPFFLMETSWRQERPARRRKHRRNWAQQGRPNWRWWAILWGITALLQIMLLANNATLDTFLWRTTRWFVGDQDAYQWNDYKMEHANDPEPRPFYMTVNPPWTRPTKVTKFPPSQWATPDGYLVAKIYKRSEIFWRVLRDLGEPVMTALIIAIVWIYDRRTWKAAMVVLLSAAGTGALAWFIRAVGGRYRPIVADGANTWHLFRGFWETKDLSWPSGHSTLAFATAAALSYLSPKGRVLFIAIAAGCAVTRVVMQAHFYSDVIFGAALGWTFGWLIAQYSESALASGGKQAA